MDFWFKNVILNKKLTFLSIIILVIIPIIINECYKTNTFYVTKWDAADVLLFYGAIVGAIGTIAGVYLSIKHTEFKLIIDTRNRVMPFLVLYGMKQNRKIDITRYVPFLLKNNIKDHDNNSNNSLEDGVSYSEDRVNDCYFIISNSSIKYANELDKTQKNAIHTNKLYYGILFGDENKVAYFPKLIENVGTGPAINLRIILVGNVLKSVESMPISIPVGNSSNLGLYFEFDDNKCTKTYTLKFLYEDILGNEYFKEILLKADFNTGKTSEDDLPIVCSIEENIVENHRLLKEST